MRRGGEEEKRIAIKVVTGTEEQDVEELSGRWTVKIMQGGEAVGGGAKDIETLFTSPSQPDS